MYQSAYVKSSWVGWLAKGWRTYRFVPFEEHHTAALIPSCEIIACSIELDGRNDISCVATKKRASLARVISNLEYKVYPMHGTPERGNPGCTSQNWNGQVERNLTFCYVVNLSFISKALRKSPRPGQSCDIRIHGGYMSLMEQSYLRQGEGFQKRNITGKWGRSSRIGRE